MRAKYLRQLFILVAMCLSLSVSAQSQERVVGQRLKNYFRSYKSDNVKLGSCKLVRMQLDPKKRTLILHANANFGFQPFRPETTERIYADIRSILPGPVNYYDITVMVDEKSIDDLIPNIYRNTKDDTRLWGKTTHQGASWVDHLSRPYRVSEGLQGRHLAVTPSHGLFYKNDEKRWKWQRPSLYCTHEDLLSQSFVVPYLTPMLENAGAVVFSARERDRQPHDIIIDNDNGVQDSGLYIEEGRRKVKWESGDTGFAIPHEALLMGDNPFVRGTSRMMHTATNDKESEGAVLWIPRVPEDGDYAVYVSYQTYPTSIPDAEYLVVHAGGTTRLRVNQQMGGGTWVYLGTYTFKAGHHDSQMVVLTNSSAHTGIVSADAVRFGGGSAIINRGSADSISLSHMPRYYEGARYQGQWSGFPVERYANYQGEKDYAEDINCRSLMTNYLLGGSVYCPDSVGLRVPIELFLGLHTDAGIREDDTTVGCLGIYTTDYNNRRLGNGTLSRYVSRDLTDVVQTSVVTDVNRMALRTDSTGRLSHRGMWDRNYSESRLPDVPSTIIELLSHQNFADMRYAHDPHFKFIASRAIYKGLLRYTAEMHGASKYTVQPLPVHAFAIQWMDETKVRLSWRATKDNSEASAQPNGYVLYTRIDEGGWDNGQLVNTTACELTLQPGHMYSFKVTAINRGGESFPSEALAAHVAANSKGRVLVVNGFQRVDGPAVVNTTELAGFDLLADPGVPYIGTTAYSGIQYEFLRSQVANPDEALQTGASGDELCGTYMAGNTFDYAAVHGASIRGAGYSFVSCSRQAFEEGVVSAQDFDVVDVFLGLQRHTDSSPMRHAPYVAVTPALYTRLHDYTQQGGALFVSGSYLGEESQYHAPAKKLLHEVLHAEDRGHVAEWSEQGISGLGTTLEIPRWINSEHYPVPHPEMLSPVDSSSAFSPFVYEHSLCTAAVAYRGDYRSVVLGFPFEAIRSASDRDLVMASLLDFLMKRQ